VSKDDPYQILGVSRDASDDQIKKAFRTLARRYHPDRNPDDKNAESRFKQVQSAYDQIGTAEARKEYEKSQMFGGGFGGGNMNDIFDMFGDIFGGSGNGGFGGFGGFGGGGRTRQAKGSNLRIKVKLTLEEVANGIDKKIKIRRAKIADGVTFKTCSTCNGAGQVQQVTNTILGQMRTAATCSSCNGSGKVVDQKPSGIGSDGMDRQEEVVSVKIPAGVQDGMQLRVGGKGNEVLGGVPGDLIVLVEEIEHESLTRDGENLHYELNLSFPDAALGCNVEIPTVSGVVKINIDAGTQPGKILRLKNKGN
jgi:molecular chaperone DnaJ